MRALEAGVTSSRAVVAPWGPSPCRGDPQGLRTLPHVLPNDNTCPRLRLCATMHTLRVLPNDNTCPQIDAPHPPILYITVNLPQVASAALGRPRRQSRLRHAFTILLEAVSPRSLLRSCPSLVSWRPLRVENVHVPPASLRDPSSEALVSSIRARTPMVMFREFLRVLYAHRNHFLVLYTTVQRLTALRHTISCTASAHDDS